MDRIELLVSSQALLRMGQKSRLILLRNLLKPLNNRIGNSFNHQSIAMGRFARQETPLRATQEAP